MLECCWIRWTGKQWDRARGIEGQPGTSGGGSRPEVCQLTTLQSFSYIQRKTKGHSGASSEPQLLMRLLNLASA